MIALLENQDETLHGFSLEDARELKKRFNELYDSVIICHDQLEELEIVQEPNDLIREFAFEWERIAEIEKQLHLFIQQRAIWEKEFSLLKDNDNLDHKRKNLQMHHPMNLKFIFNSARINLFKVNMTNVFH